jgi:hypothetical protein
MKQIIYVLLAAIAVSLLALSCATSRQDSILRQLDAVSGATRKK